MPSFADRAAASKAAGPAKTEAAKPAGKGAAPPPRQVKASNAPTAGRYAGMRGATPRYPFLGEGNFDLEVIKTYESKNPRTGSWFHLDCKVLTSDNEEQHPVGSNCTILQCVSDTAIEVGGPIVVSIVVAATGFDNDEDFFADFDGRDDEHPTSEDLLDGVSGANKKLENPLVGCKLHCQSYPGKAYTPKNSTKEVVPFNQTWSPYVEPVNG